MSYNPTLEDTQPRAPLIEPEVESNRSGGPGCMLLGCIGLAGIGFAVVIVILAGVAGWTSGSRIAGANATATRSADINEQLAHFPQDVAGGNAPIIEARIRYLATLTPGVPGLADLMATGTAVYLAAQPTITPTPSPTLETVATEDQTAEPFATENVLPTGQNGAYDLAALLQEANTDVGTAQYADAYKLLDAISGIDANYEAVQVRRLLSEAVNGQARNLFNANKPAEAVIWATRAEDLGILDPNLQYELYAATLYLNAKSSVGLNYAQAIASLQELVNQGQGRYFAEAQSLLIQQYIGYGDALVADPNQGYCPAVPQYQNAVNAGGGGTASGKLSNAQSMCSQATPVGQPTGAGSTPGATAVPGQIAPVGQPG